MSLIDLITMETASAPVFGTIGLGAQLIAPLFRRRNSMLSAQLVAATAYASTYFLMGQSTATAVCLLGAIQTTIAILAGDRAWLSRLGYLFLPAVIAIGFATYSGLPTLLAVSACCLIMIGRLQKTMLRMRVVQLGAAPFGAMHDVVVGAWPCLIGASFSLAMALIGLRRELTKLQEKPQGA